MTRSLPAAVSVPTHDEEELVGACLSSIVHAADIALSAGALDRVVVLLAAHRCSDATALRARATLRHLPAGVDAVVVVDDGPGPVGVVRHRLAIRAASHPALAGRPDAWLFSTDADSQVPPDWITGLLDAARSGDADAVAGLVAVCDWEADDEARLAYEEILAAGMNAAGHTHVYAANLAVRRRAYDAVGGFPAARHGEERELLRALRAAGVRIATPHEPLVLTSGRAPGRADQGLGALLAHLTAHESIGLPPGEATAIAG